ncbi:hypothetical protein [Streptomyces sp. NPDC093568]|uniref:hypothetical protein n=1 Tax=Streptomyces sp. NPDC093568 TaxID=3366041 RepID=UPI00381624C1
MEKITGAARYTTDIRPPGLLHGVIVRSRHAFARVRSVSGERKLVDLLPADRTVRYVGQPIAAVAAETSDAAQAAAEQVRVDYEILPAVIDVREAVEPEAPVLYPTKRESRNAPSSAEGPLIPAGWDANVRGPVELHWRGGTADRRIAEAAPQSAKASALRRCSRSGPSQPSMSWSFQSATGPSGR